MFWTLGAAVLFFAAVITFMPVLRGKKSLWQPLALALTFALPAAGLWIYNEVGTPAAINVKPIPKATDPHANSGQAADMDTMVAGLRARLEQDPDNIDGWMLLSRTLKSMQRFPEALEALETAHGRAPDNPFVMVELAEAYIFVTPDGRIGGESTALLERALDIDPNQQKAIWLMGMAAAQAGDDEAAIARWESLLAMVEPGGPVEQAVQTQINEAKSRLGQDPAPVAVDAAGAGAWPGIGLTVAADPASRSSIPMGGVLYVMIRSPGPAVGPPIGVRRVIDPVLPLELRIDDSDSMLKERMISSENELQLQARISQSGSPAAAPGDWQSAPVTVSVDSGEAVELILDQQVE